MWQGVQNPPLADGVEGSTSINRVGQKRLNVLIVGIRTKQVTGGAQDILEQPVFNLFVIEKGFPGNGLKKLWKLN